MSIEFPRRYTWTHHRSRKIPENSKLVTRKTRWGNPYKLIEHGGEYTREEALELYEKWLNDQLKRNSKFLEPLYGFHLVCYCRQHLACHGDILLKKIEEIRLGKATRNLNKWIRG
ncbi:MAG: DUF4326 domain-containing protein [Candidatus Kariarchaeaceae archaeon]|jgi:hypothetical protein